MPLRWILKKYQDLSVDELYDILQLRNKVFIVEQNCPYQDLDNKDKKGWHLSGYNDKGQIVAYSRLLPQGVSYDEVSIGRVVTEPEYRRTLLGKELMKESIERIHKEFGNVAIRIGAQLYLRSFYEGFEFIQTREPYMEDGIPHIEMIRNNKA
ncbi:MAG: GNAT family N-acetyltransferase [Bacteroidota bacterium]